MSKELLTWLFFWGSWLWSIAYIFLFDGLRIGCKKKEKKKRKRKEKEKKEKKRTYPVWSYCYLCIITICLASFYKHSRYYGSTISDLFALSKALSFDRTGDLVLFGILILTHIVMTVRIIKRVSQEGKLYILRDKDANSSDEQKGE